MPTTSSPALSRLWQTPAQPVQFSRTGIETVIGRRVSVWPSSRIAVEPVRRDSDLARLREDIGLAEKEHASRHIWRGAQVMRGPQRNQSEMQGWFASGCLRGGTGLSERVVGRARFAADEMTAYAALAFCRRVLGFGGPRDTQERLDIDLEIDLEGFYVTPRLRRRGLGHVLAAAVAHTVNADVRSLLTGLSGDPRPVGICISIEGMSSGPAADRMVRQLRECALRGLEMIENSAYAGPRRLVLSVADFKFSTVPSVEATQPDSLVVR